MGSDKCMSSISFNSSFDSEISILSIFSLSWSIVVAPIILLVTNGRSFTKAFAKVEGAILCFWASLKYFSIALSPLSVWCLENLLGQRVYLALWGFFPPIYLPLNLPPAKGE